MKKIPKPSMKLEKSKADMKKDKSMGLKEASRKEMMSDMFPMMKAKGKRKA